MNKKIMKIVALALALSGTSALIPAELNLGTKAVYAATNSNDISSLKLQKSGGSSIKVYTDNDYKSDDKVDANEIDDNKLYYAKTDTKKIKIKISGVNDDYVRVFADDKDSTKGKEVSKTISLDSGSNLITVRVYSEKPDDTPKYEDDGDKLKDYTIKVKCTDDKDDDDDDDNDKDDDIYLEDLTLTNSDNDIDFDFDKDDKSYDIKVKNSVSYVRIKAEPDDDDYKVKIDGKKVTDDDDYEEKVTLNEGENEIKVTVKDDEDDDIERTYTLNITRGSSSTTNTKTDTTTNNTNTATNQTINTSSTTGWKIENGKVYYVNNNGIKQTGWFTSGNDWYYFDSTGVRLTSWQKLDGNWYYLDSEGKMQTGWFKDWTGTWYYLNPYSNGTKGAMLHDTTVGGYVLGSSGAWIR